MDCNDSGRTVLSIVDGKLVLPKTNYKDVGLVAGIEIHQQLDTKEKLFCHCPTTLMDNADHTGDFFRYLRATESEMGAIDRAAQEEMKRARKFQYYTYPTTCLVENDEEPPAPLNDEALTIGLTLAKTFCMTPIPQVHVMRKLVIDGSNTSGFQRTALVAINGALPNGGNIETICIEEEAAQRVRDDIFSLDRLGIPLVEITTSPCMHTPEDVQQVAEYIGMVLRSTGAVKRGLGTIRQDVNISIKDGARVEIKGVQDLALIAEVVRREVLRQQELLAIRDGTCPAPCKRRAPGRSISRPSLRRPNPQCSGSQRRFSPSSCRALPDLSAARSSPAAGSGARCRTTRRNAASAGSSTPTNCPRMASRQKKLPGSVSSSKPTSRTP